MYTRSMSQLLLVLEQPHEAALMLRLLHEEGIVGKLPTLQPINPLSTPGVLTIPGQQSDP